MDLTAEQAVRNFQKVFPNVQKDLLKENLNMYESPIKIIESTDDITQQINESIDNYIYKAVLKTGIEVDKEELIKALQYDRGQYDKGFDDGVLFAQSAVAKEIFEKIDIITMQYLDDKNYTAGDLVYDLDSFKHKYMKGCEG